MRGPAGWEPEWSWALGLQEGLQAPIGERWGLRGSYEADFTGLAPSPLPVLSSMMARYQESALGVRLLTLGGVTEVVALRRFHAPGLFPAGEVPTVFAEPVRVFRVPAPLPRVYVVARARTVTGDDALRALGDPGFDPGTSVILDSASSLADGDGPKEVNGYFLVHTPAGDAPTRIRNGFATRTRHDAEQLGGRGPLPAPDAHPDGALYGHSGRVLCFAAVIRSWSDHRIDR